MQLSTVLDFISAGVLTTPYIAITSILGPAPLVVWRTATAMGGIGLYDPVVNILTMLMLAGTCSTFALAQMIVRRAWRLARCVEIGPRQETCVHAKYGVLE